MPGATENSSTLSSGGEPASRGELIAKIGTIVSAIMASSCCWLPVLLLAVGVSGAGIATALEAYRPIFMVVTFGFLGMAFYLTYRPRRARPGSMPIADCGTPQPTQSIGKRRFSMMALNKAMLWAVTVLAIVFLFFPQYVTQFLGTGNEEITADMTKTELKVEGMTCEG